MLPVLFSIGPVRIYSMGLLALISAVLGMYWWWKMGRDEHWDEIELFDMYFLGLFSFFFFGRLVYVILNWGEVESIWRALSFLAHPGINYAGGLIGGWLVASLYSRAREWKLAKVWDALSVVASLIIFVGSVGVLLNQGRIWLDLWGIFWAGTAFALTSVVRKNFRFFKWYKGDSSVAKDGLAGLTFLMLVGVYYLVRAFMTGKYSLAFLGFGLVIAAGVVTYRQMGKGKKVIKWPWKGK